MLNKMNLILVLAILMEGAGIVVLVKGGHQTTGFVLLCVGFVFLIIGMTTQGGKRR